MDKRMIDSYPPAMREAIEKRAADARRIQTPDLVAIIFVAFMFGLIFAKGF